MAEQRQQRRHPESILRVTFEHPAGGERATAVAWDASLGGMFLETARPLEEGALVILELRTADATVSVDSRVLWSRPERIADDQPAGMAVRFIDLPDDVSVALGRALQSGMRDKTILGVGGVSKEPTQIGIPVPAAAKGPAPRETQIGVAPPANEGAAPANPVVVGAAAKPRLVVSETSLPETPVTAPVRPKPLENKAVDSSRLEETAPSRARFQAAEDAERRSRTPKSGSALGRIVLLGILGVGAAGVYLNRGRIAELLAPPGPAPTGASAPTAPTPTSPSPSAVPSASAEGSVDAASPESAVVGAAADAAADASADKQLARDAGISDAGARDGGRHDAGARDAGHDAGGAKSGAPKSKHPAAPKPASAPDDDR